MSNITFSLAVILIAPFIAEHEGLKLKPHLDPIAGVHDVCYGDTQIEMREYTKGECDIILMHRIRDDYESPLRNCIPNWRILPTEVRAATISLAYNEGVHRICHSKIAVDLIAGRLKRACEDFIVYVKAGKPKRTIKGLVNRRNAEIAICKEGL